MISICILEVMCYIKLYKGGVKRNVSIDGYNMRNKLNFHVEFCSTILFQKSAINVVIKLYNTMPESIKKLDKSKPFKKELKSLLLSHSFYSIDEFLQF